MAFTRFHDDPARIQKSLIESTYSGIYHLNTPGNGLNLPYVNDVHVRLQKWGGNLQTNSLGVEDELRGLNRKLGRDSHQYTHPNTNSKSYISTTFNVDETRASHPVWLYRDRHQDRFMYLPINPQDNIFYKFENNCPTRMLEKDYYVSGYY